MVAAKKRNHSTSNYRIKKLKIAPFCIRRRIQFCIEWWLSGMIPRSSSKVQKKIKKCIFIFLNLHLWVRKHTVPIDRSERVAQDSLLYVNAWINVFSFRVCKKQNFAKNVESFEEDRVYTSFTSWNMVPCILWKTKERRAYEANLKDYCSEFAAICDVSRWEEHIVKGNAPSSFKATTTTSDGSIRRGNAGQKAENECLHEKGKELLRHIKSVNALLNLKPQLSTKNILKRLNCLYTILRILGVIFLEK